MMLVYELYNLINPILFVTLGGASYLFLNKVRVDSESAELS